MRQLEMAGPDGTTQGARIRWIDVPASVGVPDAPVRIFLHGLGSSSTHDFPELALHPALAAAGRRSLLIDLLGFGYSDRPTSFGYALEEHADAVAAVLDAEMIDGSEVIGHSMGGSVALALAARRPDLVGSLVLAEANLQAGGGTWSRRIAAWREEEFLDRGIAEYTAAEAEPGYLATLRAADARALYRSAVGLVRGTEPRLQAMLSAFDGPKAFLVGQRSRPCDEEEDARAAGARIWTIPDAGHVMTVDNPDGFARAIAEAGTCV